MNAERPRIECSLQDDERLLAGIWAIVTYSAGQAGLPEKTQEELAKTTLDVCHEAFSIARGSSSRDSAINLTVGGESDRIEITVDYPGHMTRNRIRDSVCAGRGGSERLAGVDDVECENSGGRSRVKLIKRCNALESKPEAN